MDFDDILSKYRENQHSKSDLGAKFEELIARYLMTDPLYAQKLEWAHLWTDFFARAELGGHDTGIDIVAKTNTGEYWAIQCKCYAEGHTVSKEDVDTFISASGRKFLGDDGKEAVFAERYIFATTDQWSHHALDAAHNQTVPVVLVGLDILRDAPVMWEEIENGIHGKDARREKYALRDHQKEAFNNALEHYKTNDRGRMTMACGTGKTFTSLRIAEALIRGGGGRGAYCSSRHPSHWSARRSESGQPTQRTI
jgi:predicted helicase